MLITVVIVWVTSAEVTQVISSLSPSHFKLDFMAILIFHVGTLYCKTLLVCHISFDQGKYMHVLIRFNLKQIGQTNIIAVTLLQSNSLD